MVSNTQTLKSSRQKMFFALAILTILPIGAVAIETAMTNVLALVNPCSIFGAASGEATASLGGGCSSVVSTSETGLQVMLTTVVVQGGIVVGALLGVLGILRARPKFLVAGFILLSLESVPLLFDGLFVLTLLPAVFFLLSAKTKALSV